MGVRRFGVLQGRDYQGKKIEPGLLRDAVLRTLQASDIAGIRAILVQSEAKG